MYIIAPDPVDPDVVVVQEPSGWMRRIHREDADPEHRDLAVRLAACWFGNEPG